MIRLPTDPERFSELVAALVVAVQEGLETPPPSAKLAKKAKRSRRKKGGK